MSAKHQAKWLAGNRGVASMHQALRTARIRAAKRAVPFELTKPGTARDLWEKSGGVCALSGISFRTTEIRGCPTPWSPSIDRILPELGYTFDNVRLILNGLNALKGSGTDLELFEICAAIAERHNGV